CRVADCIRVQILAAGDFASHATRSALRRIRRVADPSTRGPTVYHGAFESISILVDVAWLCLGGDQRPPHRGSARTDLALVPTPATSVDCDPYFVYGTARGKLPFAGCTADGGECGL